MSKFTDFRDRHFTLYLVFKWLLIVAAIACAPKLVGVF